MDEAEIARILQRWMESEGEYREDLLRRCLAVLGQGDSEEFSGADSGEFGYKVLSDDDLELLAAAGDFYSNDDLPRSGI